MSLLTGLTGFMSLLKQNHRDPAEHAGPEHIKAELGTSVGGPAGGTMVLMFCCPFTSTLHRPGLKRTRRNISAQFQLREKSVHTKMSYHLKPNKDLLTAGPPHSWTSSQLTGQMFAEEQNGNVE